MNNQPKQAVEKLSGHERADAVQDVFQRIAPHYDLMNKLMTGGQDRAWRRFVIKMASIPAGGKMLDIATGTGDIAFEALSNGAGTAFGADFAPAMMQAGRKRPMGEQVRWVTADALNLPFPDASFDAVTHGYLLRNVIDIPRALREQVRVVKPGGHMVCLDTSPPPPSIVRPFVLIHLNFIIPTLGTLLTGQRDAYKYLPESTKGFKSPEELAEMMRAAGFVDVQFKRFVFGTMAVHWGTKPR